MGDNAVKALQGLNKQVSNLIKVYDVDKKKIVDDKTPSDITRLLEEIEKDDDKDKK